VPKTRMLFCTSVLISLIGLGCGGGNNNTQGPGDGGGAGGGEETGRTFVYVASGGVPGRVVGFQLDDTNGTLTSNGSVDVGADPRYMSQGRSGLFLFVPSLTDGTVTSLTVHTPNGELTSDALTSGLAQPIETMSDSAGNFVYVLQNTGGISVYSVTGQGTLTPVSSASTPPGTPSHMALTGPALYVGIQGDAVNPSGIQAYAVDSATGTLTPAAFTPLTLGAGRLMLTPSRSFLVVTEPGPASQIDVFPVQSDGSLAGLASSTPGGNLPGSLAMNSSGTLLYVGNNGSGTIDAFLFSGSGGLTAAGSVAAGAGTSDLQIDSAGHFLIAANTFGGTIISYAVDASTGALTEAGSQAVDDGPVSLAIIHQE
jgi:6-phosphogluconolactonase